MHGAYPSKNGRPAHPSARCFWLGNWAGWSACGHVPLAAASTSCRSAATDWLRPTRQSVSFARLAGGDAGVCCAVAALGGARPRGGAPVATGHAGQRAGVAGGVGQPQFFTLVIIVGAAGLVLAQAQPRRSAGGRGQLPAQLQAQIMVRGHPVARRQADLPDCCSGNGGIRSWRWPGFFVELVFRFQAQATVVQIAMSCAASSARIRYGAGAGRAGRWGGFEAQAGGQLAPGQVVGFSWLARKVRPLDD